MSIRVSSWFQVFGESWSQETRKHTNLNRLRFGALLLVIFQLPIFPQGSKPADLVVINANVRTMLAKDARAEAFAVSGNRFVAVGTNKQIKNLIGPATRVIDARTKLVLPGFNDAHVHFMGVGNSFSSIDLRDLKDAPAVTERIRQYVRFLPRGRWILGSSLDGANSKVPDKKSLDAITPDNPVFLYYTDGRSAFANTRALRLANLKDDAAGIDRTATGELTGVVRGDALAKIRNTVPSNHTRNWLEIAETATNYAASYGVTSVHDMHSDDSREIYRELQRLGKLKTRVYDCIPLPEWKKLTDRALLSSDNEMVRGGCLKSFSDGDEEARPKLMRDILAADKAGLQVAIHAIGNTANRIVLDVFEQTATANGRRDRRLRVEHAHNPSVVDVPRLGRSYILASMQPHLFIGSSGGFYNTLLKQRTRIAFGSDASITDINPLFGIYAAVNAGAESISVYEAVHSYTVGSAYAEFQEKEKGTIEPGKLADFVILSDDIFVVDARTIRSSLVTMTVVNGVVVFESELVVEYGSMVY